MPHGHATATPTRDFEQEQIFPICGTNLRAVLVMGTGILSSPALVLSAGLNPARGFSPAPHLANL
jgi:hypothetical protein